MKMTPIRLASRLIVCGIVSVMLPAVAFGQESAQKPGSESSNQNSDSKSNDAKETSEESKDEDADAEESDTSSEEDSGDSDGEADESESESKHRLTLGGRASLTAGQGTFTYVADKENPQARPTPGSEKNWRSAQAVSLGLSINLSYAYGDHSIGTGFGITQYLLGGESKPQDFTYGDIGLDYSWDGIPIDAINGRFSAGAGVSFPVSESSRENNVILGVSGSVSLSTILVDSLSLSLSLSPSKTFHKYAGRVETRRTDDRGIPSVLHKESEIIGGDLVSIGGINTEWGLSSSIRLGWRIWHLRFGAGYTFRQGWSYPAVGDDFRPNYVDVDNKFVAQVGSRRYGQSISAGVSISYGFTGIDWLKGFGLTLSANTSQTPKTDDNKSFSFPFWNFSGAASNASSVTLSLGYSYTWLL